MGVVWIYVSLRRSPEVELDDVATGPETQPRTRTPTRVATPVVLLGVTSMLTDISSEMVAAVLPLYLTVFLGLSPLAYGFVDGIYQGVTVLVRVGGGFVADRTRRPKLVATVGYATSAICKLAMLPATTFAAVSSVVAIDRAGKGVRTAPRDALIAASSDERMLGRSFGVHRALDTAGAMIGPVVGFAILAMIPMGYDAVFVVSFSFALVGLAVLVICVPNLRPPRSQRPVTARSASGLLANRTFRFALLAAALLSLCTVSDGFLYLVLQRRTDLATEVFPLLFVGTTLVYFLLAVPMGRLADRVGARWVFLAGQALLPVAYLVCATPMPDLAAAVAALCLLGAYYAATDGVLSALTVPLLPESLRSTGLAAMQSVVAGGRFAAALLFGLGWTVLGPSTALVAFALAMAVALPVAGVLLHTPLHRPAAA